jgi:undecaprenyl-diphosphatase
MNILQAIVLGIIQGLTEFIPVSSSGHLALFQNYIGEIHVGFDVIVHGATLLAILVFFFSDILGIIKDFFTWNKKSENFKLVWYLLIATMPIVVIGWFGKYWIYSYFSNLYVVAMGFFMSGMFLFVASFTKPTGNPKTSNSFLVGLSQALALVPGITRSGSTVSTGILSGVKREKAVRFSFLLAIPAILGALILNLQDMATISIDVAIIGFISAFFAGLFGIFVFVKWLKLKRFRWFAFYCWLLALITLLSQIL